MMATDWRARHDAIASGAVMVPTASPWISTSVYWTNMTAGTVMKVPLTGGTATTLASGQSGSARDRRGRAVNAYWTCAVGCGVAMSIPVQRHSHERLARRGTSRSPRASGQDTLWAVAVNATDVFWTNNTPATDVGFDDEA